MEFSAGSIRHISGFLGDNNRKGIRHLTDADTCTVACSKILVQIHVVGQRQVTCCCRDTVVPYNHGSVVQRRIVFENIDQQLAGQNAVNRDSGLFIFLQGDGLFDDDQRSGLYFSHFKTGPYQFIDGFVTEPFIFLLAARKRNGRQRILFSNLLDHSSKLRLKDNYNRCDRRPADVSEQPQNRLHFQHVCNDDKDTNQKNTFHQRIGLCILQPADQVIDEKCNEQNLHNINQFNLFWQPVVCRSCDNPVPHATHTVTSFLFPRPVFF